MSTLHFFLFFLWTCGEEQAGDIPIQALHVEWITEELGLKSNLIDLIVDVRHCRRFEERS